ncbi:hypothetical protein AB0J28_42695 [Streptosporangium canum]|uniref:hypothetical protein n=1 Tax=Streptosporangium canum TaxID=324952 RepID=UPI0034427144
MRTRLFRLLVIAFTAHGTAAYAITAGRIALSAKAASPLGAVAPAQLAGHGPVMTTVATVCVIAAFAPPAYHRV